MSNKGQQGKQGNKGKQGKQGKGHELAITPRAEDYPKWYQDVVRFGELAEPAKVVKGCMVIRPHGYAIWEKIQRDLDGRFKDTGHKNAYFPLLVPQSFIMKEAEHIEGFAPELAVVTHAGGVELEEPYVIRPTSETIVGHFFAKWISSHRDLPLKINQWANVIRWELRTRMFLRTTEFLWQEGHTAHSTHEEALTEVLDMLEVYADFSESVLAVPVIRGIKTASERFAGALETYCIEAQMQDGKALQAGTSHDLGQKFGIAFDVKFQNVDGDLEHVWQTSWGVSTRLIGGLVMTHGDDDGLVLPPRVAPIHAVIIPIHRTEEQKVVVLEAARELQRELGEIDLGEPRARYRDFLEVVVDDRDMRPGAKFYDWERRGVPMRIELGPRDLESGKVCLKMRVPTTEAEAEAKNGKLFLDRGEFLAGTRQRLLDYQDALLERARARREAATVSIDTWEEFEATFAGDESKFAWCHWDGSAETEASIKEKTKVTIRCVPLAGQGPAPEAGVCVYSGKPSVQRVLMAKSY